MSYHFSLRELDPSRLRKQLVEAWQIWDIIVHNRTWYRNHPAVNMWREHTDCLGIYINEALRAVREHGYKCDKMARRVWDVPEDLSAEFPHWHTRDLHSEVPGVYYINRKKQVGVGNIMLNHRIKLLLKDPAYYAHFSDSMIHVHAHKHYTEHPITRQLIAHSFYPFAT